MTDLENGSTILGDAEEFLSLFVGDQMFGVSVLRVQDVLSENDAAPIPLSPPEIVGSINLRGRIVTVVDLRERLALERRDADAGSNNVVVEVGEEAYSLLIDEVGEVLSLDAKTFEHCPATVPAHWRELCSGLHRLDGRLMLILDVDALIGLPSEEAA